MGRRQALIAASLLVALPAHADDITVSPPAEVAGDGRTAIPIVVNGAPAGTSKALPVSEVPVLTCTDAPGLAAVGNGLPAVLVPAVTTKTTLACTARLRDSTAAFNIWLRPPGIGLYASTNKVARTTDGEATLTTFVWDGKKRAVPSRLHAAASDGSVTIGKGGTLTLGLTGKVPRTVAIAMIDGPRVGAAFVPVTGATLLPVESEPGSRVQVWVAGSWYGPVPTTGKVASVPIEVPAGVTSGVARSTNAKGYVSDVIVDLKIPPRPRIAVVAPAPTIGAGESATLAVAIAGSDARPALAAAKVVATAAHGTISDIRSLGGGLWTVRYTAPTTEGDDTISVNVDGDDRAGTATATVNVRGIAASLQVTVEPKIMPGGDVSGTVRVVDAGGIVLREPDISVTFGGSPVEVSGADVLEFHGKAPDQVPLDGLVPLVVTSGALVSTQKIRVGLPPVAAPAVVVTPAPEPASFALGAWASAGYQSNLGEWSSPRAGAGLAIERGFGLVDAAVLVGIEGLTSSDSFVIEMQNVQRAVSGFGVPIGLRARVGSRVGVSVTAALVPWRMHVSFGGMYNETVLGYRAGISGDAAVGPGRVTLGVTFGRAKLSSGNVVGQIDGLGISLGYEWWFHALAR